MKTRQSKPSGVLTAELERQTLRALAAYYDDINQSLFGGRLRRPQLQLGEGARQLGSWQSQPRAIVLSVALIYEHGWGALIEVLKHEMAHQYVEEVLGCHGETAHGPAFRDVCRQRAIDPSAAGPLASGKPSDESAKILERITKLLALAESPNQNEAQAAMSAAQRLMLKYNIEASSRHSQDNYSFRHLGKPTGRVSEGERILASILADHFFVQVIWVPVWRPLEGKRGRVLEACGTRENLEIAEYVHTFLSHTAEGLWLLHKRANGIKRNAERGQFVAGVMAGFESKLGREKRKHREQGLVWVKDAQLEDYLRRRHRYIRWGSYDTRRVTDAYMQGRDAGAQIVLHKGVQQGPSRGPKLLPAGGRN